MEPKSGGTERDRLVWVDFLRSVSICLVIVIHAAAPLARKIDDLSFADWMTGNFFNTFSRVSVPMLFMISGYLLLGRHESIPSFYRKRFQKVALPLLFWSIFYLVWANNGYANFTPLNAVKAIVYAILTAPAFFHLWFLYELLAIYLFVPVLRVLAQPTDDTYLWYFAGLWFLFGPIQGMLENVLGFHVAVDLGFFTSYIGYFVIGYLLGKIEFSRRGVVIALAVYLIGGAYTMYATYALSRAAGDFVQYYYWYTRINIVIMSIAAFVTLKSIGQNIVRDRAVIFLRRFAEASFGIYLVHAFVLITLRRNDIRVINGHPITAIPEIFVLALLISWAIVWVIQRIPVLREIAPR